MAPNLCFLKGSNSVIYIWFELNFGRKVLKSHMSLILSSCCVQFSIFRKLLSFFSKKYPFFEIFGFQRAITLWNHRFFSIARRFWIAKILYFKMIYGSKPPTGGGWGVPGPFTLLTKKNYNNNKNKIIKNKKQKKTR